jgi:hypothetical protein
MDNKIDPINDNKKEPFEEKFIKQLLLKHIYEELVQEFISTFQYTLLSTWEVGIW